MQKYLLILVMASMFTLPTLVSAQDGTGVLQILLFDYEGDEATIAANFKKRQAVYAKINPEARIRLLYDELHGSAVGRYRVHINYPNLKYFSDAQANERNSKEWQALSMGNAVTRVYEGLSRQVIPALGRPGSADAAGVVQVILLRSDDSEAAIVADIKKSQAVYAKINPEASMRVHYDEIHGAAVGRYRIHIYYPSLAYFSESQRRERNSKEWQQLAQSRTASTTRTYEGLSRVVVRSGS
jgi:hypothetical protein